MRINIEFTEEQVDIIQQYAEAGGYDTVQDAIMAAIESGMTENKKEFVLPP